MEFLFDPLISGDIVKFYNHNRGADYVLLGICPLSKKAVFVKNNAVTNNGGLFKQTKLYFEDLERMFKPTDNFFMINKVKRIVGKRKLETVSSDFLVSLYKDQWYKESLVEFKTILGSFKALETSDEVYPPMSAPDFKKNVLY